MLHVIEIPPGEYVVGNESIPNGGPQHRRRLNESVWMDALPISWKHFESFVAAGGYSTELLNGQTVDARMRQLIAQSAKIRALSGYSAQTALSEPVTGLTWFEAVEVAAFFRARLPFEVEWEIAHSGNRKGNAFDESHYAASVQQSRLGFPVLIGRLQEWTLDAFSKTYWRSDFDKRGVAWSREHPATDVSIRGASPDDMFRDVSYRFASPPSQAHSRRGFRRVWDRKPSVADIVAEWRQ